MEESALSLGEWRIALLGKTGDGKSSTGNTILGEEAVFKEDNVSHAVTDECEAQSRTVNGWKITLVDTPGFLDPSDEEDTDREIERCLNLSSPGPHAFILVLRAARFTRDDAEVIRRIEKLFTSDVFNYSVIMFTHGEGLEGGTIEDFVSHIKKGQKPLMDLIVECGRRYHVIDNKAWKVEQEGEYSNRRQIEKLFDTIEKMVQSNGGGYYIK